MILFVNCSHKKDNGRTARSSYSKKSDSTTVAKKIQTDSNDSD